MQYRDALRITAVVLAGLLAGLAVDAVLPALLVALVAYLAWLHRSLARLRAWVRNRKLAEPPEAPGVFEDIALEIDYLRERHKKRKKRLSNYLKQFQQATRALPDATVVLDDNEEVRWANAAARRDLAIRWPEDVGQRVTNIVRAPELRAFIERGGSGGSIEIEAQGDSRRVLSVLIAPYGKNQRLLVARDVTELHRANQIHSDFVANASHELRTPITVLRGYLENLLLQRELAPEAWQGALDQMNAHAERMQALVEELLLLSRLEREERVPEPAVVDVAAVIADVHAQAAELGSSKEQIFSLEVDPRLRVLGERSELYSAFSNLVFNAVSYTGERGVIRLRWFADEHGAHFEVADNGIGMAPEHLSRITERFYRVDAARAREHGGTGLGLAIVKHVLARHGASLSVSSTPGQGSVFRCDFPPEAIVVEETAGDERDAG